MLGRQKEEAGGKKGDSIVYSGDIDGIKEKFGLRFYAF